jgi:hypothetical protein
MELAELARWTPIRFDLFGAAPVVDWADLSEERFVEPFFDQTVARWASGPRARPLVRTGLEALVALDTEPSLEPAGMIFHLARCGSTLVRALGRCRHGDERQLVLKCTSWNIRRREILAAAFPETPWIWVQREPAHVLASLMASPPGWLGLGVTPPQTARLFGLDPAAVPARARVEFAARALGAMLEAAAVDPAGRLTIDYADLPGAVWQRAAPHFGLEVDSAAIERMTAESRFYSKDPSPRPFDPDASERRLMTTTMLLAAERFAEPGYRALASPH